MYTHTHKYIYTPIHFHHTTCESMCDTLTSSTANQVDNTVSVTQGGTATPGATKQLLPPDRVFKKIYINIYARSTKADITLDVCSSSFQCSFWFKNVFTFGRSCHSNRFLILRNHMGMVVPHALHSCWNPFYIRHLFGSFSFSFIFFFLRYCTKALETNVINNSAKRCYLLINGALKVGGE